MVEALRHMLGCCGEGHPSLLYLLGITPLVVMRGSIVRVSKIAFLGLKNYLGLRKK